MNNEIVEEKKNNTNKILIAIIIILLLLLGGLSYYTFFVRNKEVDKPNPIVEPTKPVESTKPIENGTPLDTKEKEYDVTYNNATHKIKVVEKSFLTDYLDRYNNKLYKKNTVIYLDNKVFYNEDSYLSNSELEPSFLKTYIFDSKYLGILYDSEIIVLNGSKEIGREEIISSSYEIYKNKDYTDRLDTVNKLEFDGHKLLFWYQGMCFNSTIDYSKAVPYNRNDFFESENEDGVIATKIALTIENDKIKFTAIKHEGYISGGVC